MPFSTSKQFFSAFIYLSKYVICFPTQWSHTVAAGPGVHPSMCTEGPSERHPLQRQQKSFHKPKPDPTSYCLITPSQFTPPLSPNMGEPAIWPKVRGLLQPASKNISEREGNPGPDQLLPQISMKKHGKWKHIPMTNNRSDYNQLFFLVFSLQASWLDKLSRYHKQWLLQSWKTFKLMKENHFSVMTVLLRYKSAIFIEFLCKTHSHSRFKCPCLPSCQQQKKAMFNYLSA